MLIGVTPLTNLEKYSLAFQVMGEDKIFLDDLIRITEIIQFKMDISRRKIEEKVQKILERAQYKQSHFKQDEITIQVFQELVPAYPTVFMA